MTDTIPTIHIIASCTTIPTRDIDQMTPALNSILNQSEPPDRLILNLPVYCDRMKKPYTLNQDEFKKRFPSIEINICPQDLGPGTKLYPTLKLIPETDDVWIFTFDDDILYPKDYLKIMKKHILATPAVKRYRTCFCVSGFNYYYINKIFHLKPQYDNYCDVAEGYFGVLYHRSQFICKYWTSYLEKILQNIHCKYYDDVCISHYLQLHHIWRYVVNDPQLNNRLLWQTGAVLKCGLDPNALHNAKELLSNTDRAKQCLLYFDSLTIQNPELSMEVSAHGK